MPCSGFHPIVREWFASRFEGPTEPQRAGWPPISAGEHVLIAAPTGSGKTLTAFLACIDRLLKESLAGRLREETRVVYVSPLRALSNDMHRNLEVPLQEIAAQADAAGCTLPPLRVGLRTGDTSPSHRAALVRRPPHILVTTPESLYLLLTARKGREMLQSVETLIVDEIHALVRDKRGSHLALTMERLEHLAKRPLQRIGLSATQKPIERMAEFLVGSPCDCENVEAHAITHEIPAGEGAKFESVEQASSPASSRAGERLLFPEPPPPPRKFDCRIVDVGHGRELDLAIEIPPSELGAVCTHEQWEEIYERIVALIQEHRSTLLFVNTRRLAERVTHQLTELLGEDVVGSHHGSLSAEMRLKTERRLKSGELKAVVATASLELGLDIGYVDLVIQLGSPRSIATFLQRIGRSGHSLGLIPKGRLFALTRDELLECLGLLRAVQSGRLDAVAIPEAPLDVLAQQIVAEVAIDEWHADELFALCRRATPYRNLSRESFDQTVEYLSEGISHSHGRSRVYLHYDRVQNRLRARKGAQIAATSNAGAIPEIASYRVVAEPERTVVGSLDEDFSIESSRGDVFLLGNTSWRILHVRGGDVTVVDAQGAPPTIPFWTGEAPGRTLELSEEVSRLRADLEMRLSATESGSAPANGDSASMSEATVKEVADWLVAETGCSPAAAEQGVTYAAAQKAAVGLLPTCQRVLFERFFDESGGMQLVVHAPFGAAINRAWGLSMRKRFCRSFDFELQATADDDGFILSLGPQHSFPIESLFPMLTPRNARGLLEQAVLTVPMFQIRWRWNVTRALLVLRQRNGKKVPPALQRFRADDLLTAVFPKLTGCQEEHTGDHELPDHPLTRQTMHDCLHEALDIDGLERILGEIEQGNITLVPRDTREPSPFSYELLNSNVYAFLDGGEIQERRARAVTTRRSLTVESVGDLCRLDPEAIRQVREEARPLVRSADELHDLLLGRIVLPVCEGEPWRSWYSELACDVRAATITLPDGQAAWVAAERLPAVEAAYKDVAPEPAISVPAGVRRDWSSVDARVAILRGLIETCGPVTAEEAAGRTSITASQAFAAFEALEGEGVVLRGRFTPDSTAADDSNTNVEWCHRRLLSRIHRLTMQGLRRGIEPVDVDVFIRYLTRRHGLLPAERRSGPAGLFEVVQMLQGIDAAATSWERDLLPGRLGKYDPSWLDELCLTGEIGWGRLFPPKPHPDRDRPGSSLTRSAPISLWLRSEVAWLSLCAPEVDADVLSEAAKNVFQLLDRNGAMFFHDLVNETGLRPAELRDAVGELVNRGMVTADGFAGLRGLIAEDRSPSSTGRRRQRGLFRKRLATSGSGRWSLWRRPQASDEDYDGFVEHWAWQLLRRWGVVFRDLLVRESGAPRWFELLQVYRRLEARGEIRGGRFIRGVAGEQFALGDTVAQLRNLRESGPAQELVVVSAADPLNLVGIVTEHARVPSTASNRVVFLDGVPAAYRRAGELYLLADLSVDLVQRLTDRLECTTPPIEQYRSSSSASLSQESAGYDVEDDRVDAAVEASVS